MGRFSLVNFLQRYWQLLAVAGAGIALLCTACGSSSGSSDSTPSGAGQSTGTTIAGSASPGASHAPATQSSSAPAASPAPAVTGMAGPSNVRIKVQATAAGTKAICAALTKNPKLAALVGTNPATLLYASGTVTNNVLGLNNVPGCQVGIDPTAANATVAWALCNFPDPTSFTDGPAIAGTTNVYNFAGAANGVIIVLGPKTLLAMLTGTAGTRDAATLATAMQDAATLWKASGGCASQ